EEAAATGRLDLSLPLAELAVIKVDRLLVRVARRQQGLGGHDRPPAALAQQVAELEVRGLVGGLTAPWQPNGREPAEAVVREIGVETIGVGRPGRQIPGGLLD